MRSIPNQLRSYGDALTSVPTPHAHRPRRRYARTRYALVAAAVLLFILGGIALLRVDQTNQSVVSGPDSSASSSSASDQPTHPDRSDAPEQEPVLWSHTMTSDAAQELFPVGGVLSFDASSNCFLLTRYEPYGVVWPYGTRVLDGEVGVRLPDGTQARPGDFVEGDGTFEAEGFADGLGMPPACRSPLGEVISFNAQANVKVTSAKTADSR